MYALMYAREFPAQALLRLHPELRAKPVVVLEGDPPREFVCSANEHAYGLGVQRGMTRPQMELLKKIELLRRSRGEEESARAALLECVGRFSPRVEELRFESALGLGADLSGTGKLLGPPETVVRNLQRMAAAMGMVTSVAVSYNFDAALCWAKAYPGTKVIARGEEPKILASIPIDVLNLTLEQSVTFSLWGIHTLGALAALPPTELVARLGQDGKQLRELACGEHPHLLKPVEPAFALQEEMEFEAGVESLDSVMFVLSPMLQQLAVRAESRTLALAAVTVECGLEGAASHVRTVRPVLPTLNHEALLKLIHLDLMANPPIAAVRTLRVSAETNQPARAQLGLFAPQFPEPMRLQVTLARLAAVVGGSDRVGAPELLDSHQKDAFRITHFAESSPLTQSEPRFAGSTRAGLRILRPAETVFVEVMNQRPHHFVFRGEQYLVMECYGPWQASGNWWRSPQPAQTRRSPDPPEPTHYSWKREQWDVVASSHAGRPLCCQLSKDAQGWWVEAVYD